MGTIIKPVSEDKVHVTIIFNFDPKIKILPYKVLNYFARKFGKGMMRKILKIAKNFNGSVFEEKMKSSENKEFYEYMMQSQNDYFNLIKGK